MPEIAARRHSNTYHRQIDLIAEMSQEFATSRDLGEALQRGLKRVAAFVEAEAASLFLIDEQSGELVCRACVGPVDIKGLRLAAGHGVVGRVVRQNAVAVLKDARHDPDFGALVDRHSGLTTRSILCAPLSVRDQRLGAIELINKAGNGVFRPGDRQLLRALGASAALAICNARLTKAMVDQERVRRELELAADIQRSMLPGRMPESFPVAGLNRPAHEVSGDFFDILRLPDGRIAFAVGDVSGKGINASLLMVKATSLFRCLVKTHRQPGRLLGAINRELCEAAAPGGMFVTMAAGLLDPRIGSVVLANAGHEPSILHRDGTFTAFAADAPPLGIAGELVSEAMPERRVDLAGGALYLFTDGLTETRRGEAMVGADGVCELISRFAGLPCERRLHTIIDELAPAGSSLRDDLTLLVAEDRRSKPLLAEHFEVCPERLSEMRHKVDAAARTAGCAAELAKDVVLAVDEACQNIFRHAYRGKGEVVLELRRDGERVEVGLVDFAPPSDISRIRPRPLGELRPGGLGTHFIRSVMDEVSYSPLPDGAGNLLIMRKVIR